MPTEKKTSDSILFQDRDIALLRGLFECRVMTGAHATSLYFSGREEAAKKRLQKLKAVGLLAERPRRTFEPAVLFLTRKGLLLLEERGILAEFPQFPMTALDRRARVSDLTIRHELEVMDVKVAFHQAITKLPSFTIAEFSTWPLLNEFTVSRPGGGGAPVLVKPDGFVRIHEKEEDGSIYEHAFFLEVDRSTEVQDVLVTRAGCYAEHYRSGEFAVRNGGSCEKFKDYPFRILIVFKTAERRNNTAERLLQMNPPILTQACLSTSEEALADPFGAIWIRPADYKAAVQGTPFDPTRPLYTSATTRQVRRDLHIDNTIRPIRPLGTQ